MKTAINNILLLSAFAMFLISCSYGTPKLRIKIENVVPKPHSHLFAVAVHFVKERLPTGISTIPDGGIPQILQEEARIYICNVDLRESKRAATFPIESQVHINFQPWILGWDSNFVYFSLTGLAGTRVEDYKKVTHLYYRADLDGNVTKLQNTLPEIKHQPSRVLTEQFVEASIDLTHINVGTESYPKETMFEIELANGELIAAPITTKSQNKTTDKQNPQVAARISMTSSTTKENTDSDESKNIFIEGQVCVRGKQNFNPIEKHTLSRAILIAGGLTHSSNGHNVQVIRKGVDGKEEYFTVDIVEVLKDGKSEWDLELKPGDRIIVPEKKLNK